MSGKGGRLGATIASYGPLYPAFDGKKEKIMQRRTSIPQQRRGEAWRRADMRRKIPVYIETGKGSVSILKRMEKDHPIYFRMVKYLAHAKKLARRSLDRF
jgi:hypothetical protein